MAPDYNTTGSVISTSYTVSDSYCHFYLILFFGNDSRSPAYTQGKGNEAPPFEGPKRKFMSIF